MSSNLSPAERLSRSEFYRELARLTFIPGLAAEFEAKADKIAAKLCPQTAGEIAESLSSGANLRKVR